MRFSVLIAHYNNSRYLQTAIESVLAQTWTNWEIVLVDDQSTDEFTTIIKPYASMPRIRILRNPRNMGCGYTKRKCVDCATGKILAFLDPDDALEPNALATMVESHLRFSDCSLIYSTHFICTEDLSVSRIADYPRALPANTPYLLLNDGSIHHLATFKRACYDQTKGIDPRNRKAVDQDLYYKLEEVGEVLFIPIPLYYYRIHAGSISNSGRESETMLIHFAIVEKACQRRIGQLEKIQSHAAVKLIRAYRTRYVKTRIIRTFRERKWTAFLTGVAIYPFVGGYRNLIDYTRKVPREGFALLRKTFSGHYEIKP